LLGKNKKAGKKKKAEKKYMAGNVRPQNRINAFPQPSTISTIAKSVAMKHAEN